MIEIDGSEGEGGGQVVRSSLALSAITGRPFTIDRIRAGRKKSGLLRQHLTGVRAVAEICSAKTEGAELGSSRLVFEPCKVKPGDYRFRIGSAGSAILVAQTVIPPLMLADGPSTVEIEGGTHNPSAPPFDYFAEVFLPLVEKMGPKFESRIDAYGFYPAGGGKVAIAVSPASQLYGFKLMTRSGKVVPSVKAIVSSLPESIGHRECSTIRRKANWPESCCSVVSVANPRGPGNAVMIKLKSDNVSEIFTGFGKRGVRAEQVANQVLREARAYLEHDVPVGPHLADQLLLPAGIAAARGQSSEFMTSELTGHSQTHIEILQKFLPITIQTRSQDGKVRVAISPGNDG